MVVLADLDDVEGFKRSGEEDQLYAFQLSDGSTKEKQFTPLLHSSRPEKNINFKRW